MNCGLRNKYESNLRSIEHFLSSSENKVGKISGLAGFEPMSCANRAYRIFIYPLSFIRNFTVCNSVVRVSVVLKNDCCR